MTQPIFAEIRVSVSKFLPFITYIKNRSKFRRMVHDSDGFDFSWGEAYPCLTDRNDAAGGASGHYFHQDLLVAQKIFESKTSNHLDVGSRIDGFVAHVATFMNIEVLDIRPMTTSAKNITFRQLDLMSDEVSHIGVFDSVSCLHALEHFGLGRYGDEIDPDGWVKGLAALTQITKQGGTLYLSVPIGSQRIEFDAHRVFSVSTLTAKLMTDFEIVEFFYIDDLGDHHHVDSTTLSKDKNNFGCVYGCGVFVLCRR
jgi:hypothetical protein